MIAERPRPRGAPWWLRWLYPGEWLHVRTRYTLCRSQALSAVVWALAMLTTGFAHVSWYGLAVEAVQVGLAVYGYVYGERDARRRRIVWEWRARMGLLDVADTAGPLEVHPDRFHDLHPVWRHVGPDGLVSALLGLEERAWYRRWWGGCWRRRRIAYLHEERWRWELDDFPF